LVVIVLLLAVWGGVGAWWFLSRPESHSTDSIGSFRQQLRVLERTGPTIVSPAYRMETGDLGVYGASRVPTMSGPGRALATTPTVAAARRRRVQKRRRDVFYGLLASVAGSAILGFLPGLSVMWALAGLLTAGLAVYVVLLMQLQAAEAERTQKVRYLHGPVHGAPRQAWAGYGDPEPAYLLRRSAN
jgi:hypothetical protein